MPQYPPKRARLYPIPAGAKMRMCRGRTCREGIYDVKLETGGKAPVHVNTALNEQCKHPTDDAGGWGVNHFVDCVDASQFHRDKPRPEARPGA